MSNLSSFDDARALFDRALASERGIAVQLSSSAEAHAKRHRLYRLRKLDREASRTIYDPADPKYGTSPYDVLVVRHVKGTKELVIHRVTEIPETQIREL